MDLKDLLKEYWPIEVGVAVVILTAVIFWPSDEPRGVEEGALVPIGIVSRPRKVKESSESAEPEAVGAQLKPSAPTAENKESEYEFLEIVNAVPIEGSRTEGRTYKTDDPEVQRALAQVEVTLYVEDECAACSSAREYLEKNGVSVTTKDVSGDSGQRERARRLSGARTLPVLVVDGKVLTGVSEGSVQTALTDAVKTRVLSSAKAQPNP